jgi:hypothetical protein
MTSRKKSGPAKPKRPGFDNRAGSYSLSRAKAFLGRLTEKAALGETVYIVHGRRRFLLQPVPEIEPLPLRPAGYFDLDHEDIELDKRFASKNIIPNPASE